MVLTALVVDDSMLIRHTVCRFFEGKGFRVEAATNGSDALELLDKLRPDVIVTDLQMPKMDGLALIRELKANPQTAAIPVVILARKQSDDMALAESARYIIFKDIDIIEQLERALDCVLPAGKTL
ncbi:MAG: response regulator [Candidatus Angelobacter sp.]